MFIAGFMDAAASRPKFTIGDTRLPGSQFGRPRICRRLGHLQRHVLTRPQANRTAAKGADKLESGPRAWNNRERRQRRGVRPRSRSN